ncbi:serine hydrolase [Bradyrhizobium sp. Ghvi]|uniref:serine hydrolase domain-containing protein n=1 Tax=Bradyrhizobium sp. Ghvi TaxID=1855319 RepID=UPI0015A652FB|nr:serine hydrolase [Bradyrhizobium sp. Ghvi]
MKQSSHNGAALAVKIEIDGLTKLQRMTRSICLIALGLACVGITEAQESRSSNVAYPIPQWEAVEPKVAGWSEDLLEKARIYSAASGSSAVMVVDHGRVVAEWGDTHRRLDVASVRKSLLSALLGIAIEEGQVKLSDTLGQLGIDDKAPGLTPTEMQATLADLLTSRSGVYHAIDLEPPAVGAERPPRGSHAPGEFWYYNNWDFNAAGSIYEKVAGAGIFNSFKQRIADPIGMQDFSVEACYYGETRVSNHRHYGFRLSARDLARFGLLYLRDGRWNEQQIVPANWVQDSVKPRAKPHSELFPGRGYGYLWWSGFASDWAPTVSLPKSTFYALGFGSQYLFVLPAQDIVIVHLVDMEREHWPWVSDFQIGRLLWLILSAARVDDIGPDTSVATAVLASADLLKGSLPGKTLRYAETALDGPYFMRFATDGTASLQKGEARKQVYSGKWWVAGNKLCRGWDKFLPRFDCWPVAIGGSIISLYGDHDTMFLQGSLETE